MKICKNCGRQTDDGKVRCPYCGYLFEEDMDSVLRKMKENLNTYKDSVANAPVQAVQPSAQIPAQPAQPAAAQSAPAPGNVPSSDAARERFELLTEVAQLKGELRALHTEIDRMSGNPAARQYGAQYAQPAPQQAPAQYAPQPQYVKQPVQYAQPAAYAPYPAQQAYAQQAAQPARTAKKVSVNRIVLSVISILLVGLSIGMFFLPWVEAGSESLSLSFKGFGGVMYIFDKNRVDSLEFATFLAAIDVHEFAGAEWIANACRYACRYIVEYGVLVYAVFLVLGFPLLFSLFGKVSCKGWHRFVAWMSFIVALLLFGVFCWVYGFSAITLWFLAGAAANFVRGLVLAFYKGKKKTTGGLA